MKIELKTTIIIGTLALLLLVAIGYIGLSEYTKYKTQQQLKVYQQGIEYGYQQTIITIMQQGATCQSVPLFANNQTLTMIPLECVYSTAIQCKEVPIQFNNKTINLIAKECLKQ